MINKERSSGFYRLSAYYMAKTVSELPLVLFQPTVFMSIIYWTTGLNVSVAFLTTLFSVLMSTLTAQVGHAKPYSQYQFLRAPIG